MANVRDFGAKGDGQADDTAAVEHALLKGDGVVTFPPGTYLLTRPVVVDLARTGPNALRGEGGTARLVMRGEGPALRLVGRHQGSALPSTLTASTRNKERFPTVSGLEIRGAHPQAVGVELVETMKATLSGVLITGCRVGVLIAKRNRNILIEGCHVYENAEYGVLMDHVNLHQINITGNHISYNHKSGVAILGGDLHNLQIAGNDIEYNHDPAQKAPDSADVLIDARDGVASEITLAGNTIQARPSPNGANVRIVGKTGDDGFPSARLIAITGNVIGSQSVSLDVDNAQRITVAGNTIYDGLEAGVVVKASDGISVTGNTHGWSYQSAKPRPDNLRFERSRSITVVGEVLQGALGGDEKAGGCIAVAGCEQVTVSACVIRDPAFRGVWLEKSRYCVVGGCTIVDSRTPAKMIAAVEVRDDCRAVAVQGNVGSEGMRGSFVVPKEAGTGENNVTAEKTD